MSSCSKKKEYFCGHCNAAVSKTLFFKHKKLYYDKKLKVWKSMEILPSTGLSLDNCKFSSYKIL